MVPLVGHVLRELDVGLDVRPGLVPDERLGRLEVRVLDREPVRPIVERPENGVGLAHEEAPSGPEEPRHDIPPAVDVGQPAERADPREDEVEASLAEDADGRVDIGLDELHVGPGSSASRRASASEAGEKSRPVIRAPSRASEIVSVPMWHWRCTPSRPATSPSSGRSKRTTSLRWSASARNRSRPYPAEAACAGARSSQFARFTAPWSVTRASWQLTL